jgi:hypothetical protein
MVAVLGRPQLRQLEVQAQTRARLVGGTVTSAPDLNWLEVVIPFRQVQEIETKIQRFVGTPSPSNQAAAPDLVGKILPVWHLEERNFLLVTYYRLDGAVDLRGLSQLPFNGNTLSVTADQWLHLELSVTLPFSPLASNATQTSGNTLRWQIQPGQVTPLSVSFWLPYGPGVAVLGLGGCGLLLWRLTRCR